jgi:hypothetical protein
VKSQDKYDPEWAEAKRRCRLNQEDIIMAKELGFRPRSLIKNIPSKSQQWKAPVKDWIRYLYEERQRKINERKPVKMKENPPPDAGRSLPKTETRSKPEEWDRLLESVPLRPTKQEMEILLAAPPMAAGEESDLLAYDFDDYSPLTQEEIEEENKMMLRRQKHFRVAAECVAGEFAKFPWVEKVAMFGSVAGPLRKEVPRFTRLRRAKVAIWHECKDLDLAVWVSELTDLNALGKARTRAVTELCEKTDGFVGVAHHQVDVFIIEPGTDRYLGRLCIFNACPKDKPECRVTDCGAHKFLQQHEGFRLRPESLDHRRMIVLFSRDCAHHQEYEIPQDLDDKISPSEDHEPREYDDDIPF